MNILVIVAHPDDEVLGMGGTILKQSQKGDKIKVVYLATGITSRRSLNYQNKSTYESGRSLSKKFEKEIENLRKDARKACKILRVKDESFYDFPDNELDSIPLLKIVKVIEAEIKKTKPRRIYTHHHNDLNIDHRVVFNATLTAARPYGTKIEEIICFEVPSSTEWNYPNKFNPNFFVNIKAQLEKKIMAMEMYKHEIQSFPHPRSSKNLRIIAGKWGSTSGTHAAEAFEIIRKIEK